jgi:hypothetical protein
MKLTPMQLRKIIKEEFDVEEEETNSLLYGVAFEPEVEQAMRDLCTVWSKKCQERLKEANVEVGSRSMSPVAVVNSTKNGLLDEIRVQIVDACESVERKCGL